MPLPQPREKVVLELAGGAGRPTKHEALGAQGNVEELVGEAEQEEVAGLAGVRVQGRPLLGDVGRDVDAGGDLVIRGPEVGANLGAGGAASPPGRLARSLATADRGTAVKYSFAATPVASAAATVARWARTWSRWPDSPSSL